MADETTAQPAEGSSGPPPVVTLFEAYGAGATEVGQRVAQALGLPFHAQAFSSEEIEDGSEQALRRNETLARVFAALGGAYGGFDGGDVVATQREQHALIRANDEEVFGQAEQGGVVVGRNGALILAQRPNTVHVLLTGTVEDRVRRGADEGGIPLGRAASRQRREDDVRAEMSRVFYGWDPKDPQRYDLVIDTSQVSLDEAVEQVLDAVRSGTRAEPPR
jgi:cytidylate kinase